MLVRSSLAFRYFIGSSSRVVPCPNLSQPVWQPKVSQTWCTLRLFFHNCCSALFWDCNSKFWGFLESLVILLAIGGLQFCYSQKTNYKVFQSYYCHNSKKEIKAYQNSCIQEWLVVIAIQINLLGYVYGALTFVYNIGIIFPNLMVIHLLRRKKL